MATHDVEHVVNAFNDCITEHDLVRLGALMSEDHLFVDTGGNTWQGRANCLAAWSDFFAAFPDYRNLFSRLSVREDVAVVTGESTCSHPMLSGPALWVVRVEEGCVAEWRVYDDTKTTRADFGID